MRGGLVVRKFNVITGVPRSGSTLLCNLLNQNPEFYAGSTSPLPALVGSIVHQFSHLPEIQAALARDSAYTNERMNNMARALVECWYMDRNGVVFDKARGWSFNSLLLTSLYPEAKIVVCVRDLRGVFGSVEKQHRKNPVLDHAADPNSKTILSRADGMLSPGGLIGQSVLGTNDLMDRMPKRVFVVHYESFTRDPRTKMMELYEFLKEPYYEHDFSNVQNTAEDLDALYLNKFPHEGSGEVKPANRLEWTEYVPAEIGGLIYGRYPRYNTNFGYQ
jgi:sulfotransferase